MMVELSSTKVGELGYEGTFAKSRAEGAEDNTLELELVRYLKIGYLTLGTFNS